MKKTKKCFGFNLVGKIWLDDFRFMFTQFRNLLIFPPVECSYFK